MNEVLAHIARFLIHDVGGNVAATLLIAGIGWVVRRMVQKTRRLQQARRQGQRRTC
ncbi:MAG: hypothetical protein HOY79_36400 [Streptomyces sp.]|nr:hypothetical protein [Streptomyces sp.]